MLLQYYTNSHDWLQKKDLYQLKSIGNPCDFHRRNAVLLNALELYRKYFALPAAA